MRKGIQTGEHRACKICGSVFYIPPYRVKRGNACYCSPSCAGRGRMERQTPPLADRFWSKVKRRGPEECWPWTASTIRHGYGSFRFNGRAWVASRVAYLLANGEFDLSQDVLHSCDNPNCCNPAHLRIGTARENAADMMARRRHRPTSRRGEKVPAAKLTEDEVRL